LKKLFLTRVLVSVRLTVEFLGISVLIQTALLLAGFLIVGGSGCSQRKLPALGPSNLLTIVTNLAPEDVTIAAIKAAFSKPVVSVEQENRYTFEVHGPEKLARQRDSRNLILVADLGKHDAVSRKAREVLGRAVVRDVLKRGSGYRVLPNVEAFGQTMLVVAGPNGPSMMTLLETRAEEVYTRTDSMVTERARDIVYMNGEDAAMGNYLYSKYGWSVRIPKGFKVAEDSRNRVVKLVSTDTQEPSRLFLAHWAPAGSADLDPSKCLQLRARLAWVYYDEDRMELDSTKISEAVFQGRRVLRIDGIWQNEKHLIGGPFFTLCFVDDGRLYLLDGIVFAPGMDKSPWLRQLEAIMLTFRDRKPAA
jgi:hypothetical protein